jgi:hypothetical protein
VIVWIKIALTFENFCQSDIDVVHSGTEPLSGTHTHTGVVVGGQRSRGGGMMRRRRDAEEEEEEKEGKRRGGGGGGGGGGGVAQRVESM